MAETKLTGIRTARATKKKDRNLEHSPLRDKYQNTRINYTLIRGTEETPALFENDRNLQNYPPLQPSGRTSQDGEVLKQVIRQAAVQYARETRTPPVRQKGQEEKGAAYPRLQIGEQQWIEPESQAKILHPPNCQTSKEISGEPISLDKASLKHEAETHISNQNADTNKQRKNRVRNS